MKNLIAPIIIFLSLIALEFFSIMYLNKVCTNLVGLNTQLEEFVRKGQWDKANNVSMKLYNKWEKDSDKISVFINHTEIDNVSNELIKLTQYVQEKNKDESLASTHAVKFFLKHVMESEKINLQNIF